MTMVHKAYAFDWLAFERELLGVFDRAMATKDPAELHRFIDARREWLKDPFEGNPLTDEWWQREVDPADVHQVGEVALTRYFDPTEDWGLQSQWIHLDRRLPEQARAAVLGQPIGPPDDPFDPGKQGTYFQTPAQAAESLAVLRRADLPECPEVETFVSLLGQCVDEGKGLYVTF